LDVVLNQDDRGAMAIIVALFAVAMFILGSMVVQSGGQRESRGDAQNAADSAALAAAEVLADSTGTRGAAVAAAAKFAAASNFPPGSSEGSYFDGCTAKVPPGWQRANQTSCVSFKPEQDASGNTSWTAVQVVTPTVRQSGLFGAASTDTRALAQASITPAPLVSPPVLFGASTTCPDTVEWSAVNVTGDIHSNNDLTMGSGTVRGDGTYRGVATNVSLTTWTPVANNPLNVSADETDPRTYPKTYDIADFEAGGRFAADPNFHDFSGRSITRFALRTAGFLTGNTLDKGIYFTDQAIRLRGGIDSSLGGTTFVTDGGTITVRDSANLTPYAGIAPGDLLMFSSLQDSSFSGCDSTGVNVIAATLTFAGVIYSPAAALRISDSSVTTGGGSLVGTTVQAVGTSSLDLAELPRTIVSGSPDIHLSK
jgi:Flp pilus assembly protein TadG